MKSDVSLRKLKFIKNNNITIVKKRSTTVIHLSYIELTCIVMKGLSLKSGTFLLIKRFVISISIRLVSSLTAIFVGVVAVICIPFVW